MIHRLKPLHLVKIALFATVIAVLPALAGLVLPDHWDRILGSAHGPILIASVVFFLTGIALDGWAEWTLRNGKAAGRWTDAELAESSRWIGQPIMIRLNLAMLFAYIAAAAFILMTGRHMGGFGMIVFPSITLSRLITSQRPDKPTRLREPPPQPAPLHSEHWGNHA